MARKGYYPKKLIYLGDNTSRALLISSPRVDDEMSIEALDLGETAFLFEYAQVAAACGVELVHADDIKIIKGGKDE